MTHQCFCALRPSRHRPDIDVVPAWALLLLPPLVSGGGVASASSDSCGIRGLFGDSNEVQVIAASICPLSVYQDVLTQFVTEFCTKTDESFFSSNTNRPPAMQFKRWWHRLKIEIEPFSKNNWKRLNDFFHVLRDSNRMLFSNQQLNFNYDTLSSLLAMIFAGITSYRSALFAFRMNILIFIPVLLGGLLSMSLISIDSLLGLLESVAIQQSKNEDRLSLAIPMTDLLSYYDSRLLDDVIAVPEGLLLTLNIQLVSWQTVFTLLEAKLMHMPYPDDPQSALK